MRMENLRKAVVAKGVRILRFTGLLAIGIGIGLVTTEMLPEPVAAATEDCNDMRCDTAGWWFWSRDVCEYAANFGCWLTAEECRGKNCGDVSGYICDEGGQNSQEGCER